MWTAIEVDDDGKVRPRDPGLGVTFDLSAFVAARADQARRIMAALDTGYAWAARGMPALDRITRLLAQLDGGDGVVLVTPNRGDLPPVAPSLTLSGLAWFDPFDFSLALTRRRRPRIWLDEVGSNSPDGEAMPFADVVRTTWHELKHLIENYTHTENQDDMSSEQNRRWLEELLALGREFPGRILDPVTGALVPMYGEAGWKSIAPEG